MSDTIRSTISWPPSAWSSPGGASPTPAAVITRVRIDDHGIHIYVVEDDQEFHLEVPLGSTDQIADVAGVLLAARGLTIEEAGNIEVRCPSPITENEGDSYAEVDRT